MTILVRVYTFSRGVVAACSSRMHIPGSVQVQPDAAVDVLDMNDDIIVVCSDVDCVASQFAYRALVENGYTNVRRCAGGLSDWQAGGYPLEGTAVET
ncbi:MAG: rhodanese-like domain-containing protein [Acidimicrobiia bacterium]